MCVHHTLTQGQAQLGSCMYSQPDIGDARRHPPPQDRLGLALSRTCRRTCRDSIWRLDSTAPARGLRPASRTHTDVFAHPDTGRHCTHVEKRHVLSRPCAHRHTGGRPGAQRTPFPGPCCHTVETPRPPRAPPALPHPAQPVAWMKRQKYGWGGRGGQRGREGAEDEIIILPGLFISVIISGVFTPPPRPLPADPA